MDHPLISLIDQAIAKAEAEGQFDNLPGAGKPLDVSGDPLDALNARIRREEGVKAPIAVLRDQIAMARAAVDAAPVADLQARMKDLADLELKLALEIEAVKRFG